MPSATFLIEFNWSGDGSTWVDETSRVVSCEWEYGRDRASMLTGRSMPGRARFVMQNDDGRFSPLASASAIYPNVLPGRRVKISATAPVSKQLWDGYTSISRPQPRDGRSSFAVIEATGPLSWISRKSVDTAAYTAILSGTAVGHILDDVGWSASRRDLDAGKTTMAHWFAAGDSAMDKLRDIEESEFGFLRESNDGDIVFEDRSRRLTATRSTAIQATFSDNAGATLLCHEIEHEEQWEEVFNEFSCDVESFLAATSAIILWELPAVQIPIAVDPGTTVTFYVTFPTPGALSNPSHVSSWTTPVLGTDIIGNSASDGSGSDTSTDLTLAVTKRAVTIKLEITNPTAAIIYLRQVQVYGTPVSRSDPLRIIKLDSTSQTTYGKKTYKIPSVYVTSRSDAEAICGYGLSIYKDPFTIASISFHANRDTNHLTEAINREVSDRIYVIANTASTQLGISANFFVEKIRHSVDINHFHKVTYDLSSAWSGEGGGGFWILGTSKLGATAPDVNTVLS